MALTKKDVPASTWYYGEEDRPRNVDDMGGKKSRLGSFTLMKNPNEGDAFPVITKEVIHITNAWIFVLINCVESSPDWKRTDNVNCLNSKHEHKNTCNSWHKK